MVEEWSAPVSCNDLKSNYGLQIMVCFLQPLLKSGYVEIGHLFFKLQLIQNIEFIEYCSYTGYKLLLFKKNCTVSFLMFFFSTTDTSLNALLVGKKIALN